MESRKMPGKKRKEKLLFRNSMLKVCSRWRTETKNYVSGTKAQRVAGLPMSLETGARTQCVPPIQRWGIRKVQK